MISDPSLTIKEPSTPSIFLSQLVELSLQEHPVKNMFSQMDTYDFYDYERTLQARKRASVSSQQLKRCKERSHPSHRDEFYGHGTVGMGEGKVDRYERERKYGDHSMSSHEGGSPTHGQHPSRSPQMRACPHSEQESLQPFNATRNWH